MEAEVDLANKKAIERLHRTILQEAEQDGRVRCGICQRRCRIRPGRRGYCETIVNRDGALYSVIYGVVSSAAVDPIEKKPLFHFYPGSQVLSLGSFGCNMRCRHCQNWEIAYADPAEAPREGQMLLPADAVKLAQRRHCQGIAWTYNEPAIWLDYTLDSARLAREAGLYTAYVTNGYITPEGLDLMGSYLDAYRVDVKGFDQSLYGWLAYVPDYRVILDVAVRARQKWNMHVEVVTNVIPGRNDAEEQLRALAEWIRDTLGPLTPWHVTRFFPHAELGDVPATPIATLERAFEVGREVGLKFVYLGNVPGNSFENTFCYQCGREVVHREGYSTRVLGVKDGKCTHCGAELNIRGV